MAGTSSESEPVDSTAKIRDSLEQALDAEKPEQKDYHIRTALQYCLIQSEH